MKEKIAAISILANLILAAVKITVGVFSNSAAILAAGFDSFADIFSSTISFLGIKAAGKPADDKHPYGHYKYEVLAGIVIAAVVFAAGAGIIYDSYKNFFDPPEIKLGSLAFGVMIFSVLANELMSRLKIFYGKRENSISLLSDGVHSRVDVYSSLAVLAGLFLSRYWIHADAVLAAFMGAYIIKEAVSIGKEAGESLLDVSAGPEMEEEIRKIAEEKNIEIKDLKTQKKGSAITANLEIKLSSGLSVAEASKISENLRSALMEKIEKLQYAAIQISSHDIETSFYKPGFGKGFGWQKKGKSAKKAEEAEGRGPEGDCLCPECGYKTPHKRGIPCTELKCPKCGANLSRE